MGGSLVASDQLLDLLGILGGRGQVDMSALSHDDVVFDTNTTDAPILFENVSVEVLARLRVLEVWLENEAAEVDLDCGKLCVQLKTNEFLTPGSTVTTPRSTNVPRRRK